jgi:hypothetical protein
MCPAGPGALRQKRSAPKSATAALAVDFLAQQSAASGAEDGARRAVATRIDGASDQSAADTADDQAGRAVGLAAWRRAFAPSVGTAMETGMANETAASAMRVLRIVSPPKKRDLLGPTRTY